MITGLTHVSEGMVTDDGTARAKFHVKYSCCLLYTSDAADE